MRRNACRRGGSGGEKRQSRDRFFGGELAAHLEVLALELEELAGHDRRLLPPCRAEP